MKYQTISADGHIDMAWMPKDLFIDNSPSQWQDQVPHVVETESGLRWFAEGIEMGIKHGPAFTVQIPEEDHFSQRIRRMYDVGFFTGPPHPATPELRKNDMRIDEVDAEVIYGILGTGMHLQNKDLVTLVYGIYNRWVADFCRVYPGTFFGLACIPNHDPEIAASELRRAASLGLSGADFHVTTASKPLWHRSWDPLWAAAEECEMPISFHSTGGAVRQADTPEMAQDYHLQLMGTGVSMFQISSAEYLAGIIVSGALERYPGLKFVLGEAGVGWIPFVLGRLDIQYEDRLTDLNFTMMPSDYWRRQGYSTYQYEPIVADLIHLIGENNVMWGSDYPHPDGVWPDSQSFIQSDLGSLDASLRQKIVHGNAAALYKIT